MATKYYLFSYEEFYLVDSCEDKLKDRVRRIIDCNGINLYKDMTIYLHDDLESVIEDFVDSNVEECPEHLICRESETNDKGEFLR